MIFLDKNLRGEIPPQILDHMARVWREEIPCDRDIFIDHGEKVRRITGDWFTGNMEKEKAP